jgi:hypothetical protein
MLEPVRFTSVVFFLGIRRAHRALICPPYPVLRLTLSIDTADSVDTWEVVDRMRGAV